MFATSKPILKNTVFSASVAGEKVQNAEGAITFTIQVHAHVNTETSQILFLIFMSVSLSYFYCLLICNNSIKIAVAV